MREGWDKVELGRICSIKGGKRLPKGHELIEIETDHKYIRARDIKNGKINFDQPTYISESTFNLISRYIVNKGDVIITIVGANIGDTAMVTGEFDGANLTENAVKLVSDKDKADSLFLKYALVPNYMKYYFQIVASGAAQDKLGIYKIKKIKINLPPLKTQRKIASILSAYDDLIENNLKRIKLLEEQAQLTYEEWFVRFKFPGHETTKFDEETGLPEGFNNEKFENLFTINNGYAFKSNDYRNDGVKILRTKDYSQTKWISIDQPIYLSKKKAENYSRYFVKEYDLMLIMVGASIGNYGIVLPKDLGVLQNQNQWAIRSKNKEYNFFKILMMEDLIKSLLNKKTGAARDFFRASFLKEMVVVVPDNSIIKQFNDLIEPIYSAINTLFSQNQHLKEARDILLPRLMSGMIDVEKLEVGSLKYVVNDSLGMVAEDIEKYKRA
ncbi:restriction endonuclease subunit S [Winogradskyella marincola]|uniref:Restriction endonuclease subunit S n=1 Tax=Winogradskyella marincola TaxID=3037795 RepID=A0ABT6G397_9FLAO|nr:restriction endonuclease subunit S [Winogradskyella sp. YYF002]MDG4716531.1 restriction endonuclease subunit S [Winogradskyella sp. YYF002]